MALRMMTRYQVNEDLCQVLSNSAILFEKNAIFRKGTSAHFDAKLGHSKFFLCLASADGLVLNYEK